MSFHAAGDACKIPLAALRPHLTMLTWLTLF